MRIEGFLFFTKMRRWECKLFKNLLKASIVKLSARTMGISSFVLLCMYKKMNLKNDKPWIVYGDFNYVRYNLERIGREKPNIQSIEDFNNSLWEAELQDLKWWGKKYTWWNKQVGNGKFEPKFHRVLVNNEWMPRFPTSDANFLLLSVFYHSPTLVHMGEVLGGFPKPFKFFDMLTQHGEFLKVVKEGWDINVNGDPLYLVVQKLKCVKSKFKW